MALDDFEDTSLVFPECLDDISMTDSDGSSSKRTSPVSSEGSDTCLVPEADDDEVPESKFSLAGRKKVVIVTQEEVEKEFVVANARVNLSNCPTHKGAPPTEPEELSRLLIENLLFDSAFDILRAFQLDTYDLFFAMTREAILIDSVGDREILGVIASTAPNAWTRQNRRHCNIMDGSEEHWDIVRGILKDTPDDSSALRAICTAFLSHKLDVPSWLHVEYTNYDVNDYLRCLIDYARYSSALGLICHVIDDENSKLTSTNARTCLPYGNINEVLVFTKKIEEESENGEDIIMLRKIVEEKLKSYFTRLQSLEKAVKLTQISSS